MRRRAPEPRVSWPPDSTCRPAVSEHIKVLREAGLVAHEQVGRERHYRLDAAPLLAVGEWLHPFERYWRDRLRHLDTLLEKTE